MIIHKYHFLSNQSLIRFVQGGVGGGYMRKLLAEKQQWCRRTMALLNKLDPGMSLSRGSLITESLDLTTEAKSSFQGSSFTR